jgi:hypothetical protein
MLKARWKTVLKSAGLVLGLCGLCCAPALIAGGSALFATGAVLAGEAWLLVVAAVILAGVAMGMVVRRQLRNDQGPSCNVG